MGRKIFVSYKYADDAVYSLDNQDDTTVRNYVDKFEELLDETDHIYKGESDGDDLSNLSEDTIWEKLKDRIYDSTLTIIFISKNMKESIDEKEQWIPWEVSYSLKETSRHDKNGNSITSKTNAMMAVVLPDENNSYSYYLESKSCCSSGCTMHHTGKLFEIIRANKFNYNNADKNECEDGSMIWNGKTSYIEAVKWSVFEDNIDTYINNAYKRQDDIDNYTIKKEL